MEMKGPGVFFLLLAEMLIPRQLAKISLTFLSSLLPFMSFFHKEREIVITLVRMRN